MKSTKHWKSLILALSAIATTTLCAIPQAKAVNFEEQRISQDSFAVVAVPFGYEEHRLEIIEQIPGGEECWRESGNAPTTIDLLLLNYDHSDSCRRIVDTNGYTLRLNGQDERVAHVLKIVKNQGELQLVAFHKDPSQPHLVIGKTNGLTGNAMKLILNPGWQITKRVHEGQVIDHLYLSSDTSVAQNTFQPGTAHLNSSNSSSSSTVTSGNTTTSSSSTTSSQTKTPPMPETDTKALVDGVSQIYNNVVNPMLENMLKEANKK